MLNCRNFWKFSEAFGGRQGQTPASSLGRSDLFSTAHLQGSSSATDDTQHLTSIRIQEVAPQQGPGSQARPRVGQSGDCPCCWGEVGPPGRGTSGIRRPPLRWRLSHQLHGPPWGAHVQQSTRHRQMLRALQKLIQSLLITPSSM